MTWERWSNQYESHPDETAMKENFLDRIRRFVAPTLDNFDVNGEDGQFIVISRD